MIISISNRGEIVEQRERRNTPNRVHEKCFVILEVCVCTSVVELCKLCLLALCNVYGTILVLKCGKA